MRSLTAYRHAAAPARDLIRLCSNESAYGPLPSVVAAVADAVTTMHRYPDPTCEELRHELARRIDAPVSNVHVGPGSGAVLTQLVLATVSADDQIVSPWPSFELYPILAQLAGAELVRVPLHRHTADVDALIDAVTERTRVVLLANPNNPTSTVIGTGDVVRLLDALPPDVLLVVDEAYGDFCVAEPETGLPAMVASRPNLVVTRTFSKLHGLASLRIGWCVADPTVIAALSTLPPPFAVNGPAQAAALASLSAEHELAARRVEMATQRRRLVEAVRAAGWEVPEPAGNFVWVAAGPRAGVLGQRLERDGVLARVVDGEGVRITIGTAAETSVVTERFPSEEDLP